MHGIVTSEIKASCKYLKKDHHYISTGSAVYALQGYLNEVRPFRINPKGVSPLSTALVTFTTQARRPQYKLTDGLQGFRPKKVVGAHPFCGIEPVSPGITD